MESQTPSIVKLVADNAQPSTLLTLFLIYILTTIIYRIFFHPLRNIPGPFPAKFTELWRTQRYFRGTWHVDILHLHRTHGPVVRLSPNEVSFVSAAALTTLYSHASGTKKTSWYDTWRPRNAANSFFNATAPAEHAFLRTRVSAVYSMTAILAMEAAIQPVATATWTRFRAIARSAHPVIALHDWVPFFAFDVVGAVALGAPMGFVEAGGDVEGIIASIHNFFFWSANLGFLPGQTRGLFHPLTQRLLRLVGIRADGADFLNNWMLAQIRRRRERGPPSAEEGERGDMLDHFLAMREADGSAAGDAGVLAECGNIIGAGADTTAIGIRAVLGALLLDGAAKARVRGEVDGAYARHGEAGGGAFGVLEKLPFLAACVREALRLHPSILYQLPREAPARGVSVGGYYVPPGATVSMSPVAQNRCVEVFGADAEEWRPGRWIVGEGADEPYGHTPLFYT